MRASDRGDISSVAALIDVGARLDAVDHSGKCALSMAIESGNAEVAALLIAAGAYCSLARGPKHRVARALDIAQQSRVARDLDIAQQIPVVRALDIAQYSRRGAILLLQQDFRDTQHRQLMQNRFGHLVDRYVRAERLISWRQAVDAGRDAGLVFRASAEGRPLELRKRLRLGAKAGGLDTLGRLSIGAATKEAGEGWIGREGWRCGPLMAAVIGGHEECANLLAGAWEDRLCCQSRRREADLALAALDSIVLRPPAWEWGALVPAEEVMRRVREAGIAGEGIGRLLERCQRVVDKVVHAGTAETLE